MGAGRRWAWIRAAIFIAAYVASDLALRGIAVPSSGIIPWYPGAGIALVYLTIDGPPGVIAVITARVVLELMPTASPQPPFFFVIEVLLQSGAYVAAAVLIRRKVIAGINAWQSRHAVWLVGALLVSSLGAALVAALISMLKGVPLSKAFANLLVFASGDLAGALVIVPACLNWTQSPDTAPRLRAPSVGRLVLVFSLTALALSRFFSGMERADLPYVYVLCLFAIALTALRDGLRGAVFTAVLLSLAAVASGFGNGIPARLVPFAQAELISYGIVALFLGATQMQSRDAASRYWHVDAERRRARQLLEAAFRSSRDAMILYRADNERILDANDVWCAATGYEHEELVGRSLGELNVWSDPADSLRMAEVIREHGSARDFEVMFNRRAGSNHDTETGYALLSAVPAVIEGVTYHLVSARDITQEKARAEAESRTRRLEELGHLAGGVAHDFNNLLTVVMTNAELALTTPAHGVDEELGEILRASERGRDLTRRLLAFSRNQPKEQRRVDVGDVVRRAIPMMRALGGHDITFEMEMAEEAMPVMADPTKIDQILLNFTVNSRYAMPDGGLIRITLCPQVLTAGAPALRCMPDLIPGAYVRLEFTDTGEGMDEKTIARVFEPFFTTRAASEGTGLGLSVVYGIVRHAHGGIAVASKVGRGTTFTIYWPMIA